MAQTTIGFIPKKKAPQTPKGNKIDKILQTPKGEENQ